MKPSTTQLGNPQDRPLWIDQYLSDDDMRLAVMIHLIWCSNTKLENRISRSINKDKFSYVI